MRVKRHFLYTIGTTYVCIKDVQRIIKIILMIFISCQKIVQQAMEMTAPEIDQHQQVRTSSSCRKFVSLWTTSRVLLFVRAVGTNHIFSMYCGVARSFFVVIRLNSLKV